MWINFCVDKFLKNLAWINFREWPSLKNFAWINFREWPGLKFAWIYFRENREFENYFSLMRKIRGRGSKLRKFESMYFLNHPIPISSIAEQFLKFILRGLIFANCHFSKILRELIFAKSQKIHEIAKFYPREN